MVFSLGPQTEKSRLVRTLSEKFRLLSTDVKGL